MSLLDPALLTTAASAIETAINAALTMDPAAQKHLKRLRGCVLALEISSTGKVFYFGIESRSESSQEAEERSDAEKSTLYRVSLLAPQETSSVQVKGSILALIKLASAQDKNTLFKTKEIEVSGDTVRAQQIQAFLSAINIDWEGLLANFIGDVPAHILGTSLRQSLTWGKSFTQALIRDAEEFVKYELRLFPNKAIASKQFAAIDKLYQATENLEKRIRARLNDKRGSEQKRTKTTGEPHRSAQ